VRSVNFRAAANLLREIRGRLPRIAAISGVCGAARGSQRQGAEYEHEGSIQSLHAHSSGQLANGSRESIASRALVGHMLTINGHMLQRSSNFTAYAEHEESERAKLQRIQ